MLDFKMSGSIVGEGVANGVAVLRGRLYILAAAYIY